ncbi:MAG: alpha/beta fold hydrolase [Pseudolysinimonas sp.]
MTGSPFTAYVRGGELHGHRFGPDDDGAPTILAIHGVTASSRAFLEVAAELSGYRILAPDLRGRARSRELPPPFGLRQHAEDLASLMQTYDMRSPVVVGHSMGAFVAVALAEIAEVSALVLVDGGFPLLLPEGVALPEMLQSALGPALDRLDREFASVEDYLAFWREHPAMAELWNPAVEDYLRYDLVGEPPHLRPSARREAVLVDSGDQFGPEWYLDAMRGLRMPVSALRAPRGLLNAEPLYAPRRMEEFRTEIPQLAVVEVPDVNHYSIVMAPPGARQVADVIRSLL